MGSLGVMSIAWMVVVAGLNERDAAEVAASASVPRLAASQRGAGRRESSERGPPRDESTGSADRLNVVDPVRSDRVRTSARERRRGAMHRLSLDCRD